MITKTAGVVAFKKNTVLLVEHLDQADHPTGIYGLPAGRLKKKESPIDGARREFVEESGLETKIEYLVELPSTYKAIVARKNKKLSMEMNVFYCRKYSGKLKNSLETKPEWVSLEKLSTLNLLPNVLHAIKQAFVLRN